MIIDRKTGKFNPTFKAFFRMGISLPEHGQTSR
jgi:hypothetical protein